MIAVTGSLGDSAAGLKRLKEGAPLDDPLVRAHLRPQPPLAAGRQAARLEVPCAIAVSDGLLQDLRHVCALCDLGSVVRPPRGPRRPQRGRDWAPRVRSRPNDRDHPRHGQNELIAKTVRPATTGHGVQDAGINALAADSKSSSESSKSTTSA